MYLRLCMLVNMFALTNYPHNKLLIIHTPKVGPLKSVEIVTF